MAKTYQLVAWTENGQVKMIPSEVTTYLQGELDAINSLVDRIRYRTVYERGDIFRVSQAYEKLAVRLLDLGRVDDAFEQYAQAAQCCLSSNEWDDIEWGETLCKPLQGRFFAMFCECKDLVRKYPRLRFNWDESGLQQSCNSVTSALRCLKDEWDAVAGDPKEAREYTKALRFGKDEVYRRRRA